MNITVTVDRPLGSRHPKYPDTAYPVNYGYVPGVPAPDGEAQDVYILGIDTPLKTYSGKLIAIVHRLDDTEDKWVAAPECCHFTAEEVLRQVWFQEKYFNAVVQMLE